MHNLISICLKILFNHHLSSYIYAAELQGGSSLSHRALEVMTATAWRCIPWRSVLRLSTITCSAGWARGGMSAPRDVAAGDRETGVFVNRLFKIGSGDLTGTALRARKGTCQTWAPGPPSLRWRCGNRKGELWLRCSSRPLPILTTAGQDIDLTQVTAQWELFRPVIFRIVTLAL